MRTLASLASFRASILAALGLAACGGNVAVSEGTGGGSSSSSSSSSSGGPATECAGAVPVMTADGQPSGFARCPDGTVHRNSAVACNVDVGIVACTGTEMTFQCKADADCTEMPHGRCTSQHYSDFGGDTTQCGCTYPCANDADCGAGRVCVCAGVVDGFTTSMCARSSCVTGADCPSGECGLSVYPNGCYTEVSLACRSSGDVCRTEAQCASSMPGSKCVVDSSTGAWACLGTGCAIGRPLLVDGEARTAPAIERGDWTAAGAAPSLEGLDAATREQLAAHWLEVAALEHASVASFARFTLELMSLGAPAHLLVDAQRAALDEVEHARIAYAIASAYGARSYGPGALDLAPVALRADRRAVLQSLIAEGCVGETLGVAEALELAAIVRDPALRRAHARIAADEQRHAELAWRTLAWLLSDADTETRSFAARCFDEATAAAARDPEARPLARPEHGLLAAEALGAVRRRALAEVIAPCAAALLGAPRATAQLLSSGAVSVIPASSTT